MNKTNCYTFCQRCHEPITYQGCYSYRIPKFAVAVNLCINCFMMLQNAYTVGYGIHPAYELANYRLDYQTYEIEYI